ncbi:hypothetical protein DLD99_05880 [Pseudomonas kribbensis]|uniref:Uncharacterized protein n=1 Tax=Pseudomonas kribbensis TaxID=1628086 RepID=A0A345RL52_9PSED|nr:hypothetical protein DLD99_05880 [Pseudomonas kribbensis]
MGLYLLNYSDGNGGVQANWTRTSSSPCPSVRIMRDLLNGHQIQPIVEKSQTRPLQLKLPTRLRFDIFKSNSFSNKLLERDQ